MASEVYESKDQKALDNIATINRLKNLKVGIWYDLYLTDSKNGRCIHCRRKLLGHHENWAQFETPSGLHKGYTYGTLLCDDVFNKPTGKLIWEEREVLLGE